MVTDSELESCDYKNCEQFIPSISRGKIVKCYDGDTVTIATIMMESAFVSIFACWDMIAPKFVQRSARKKVAQWANILQT